MRVAYMDTSCLVSLLFGEKGGTALGRRLQSVDRLIASNLLEAELQSVFRREDVEFDHRLLPRLEWVIPDRPLGPEIERVLRAGYVRGADCWHLATALYVSDDPSDLVFLTLDDRQRGVAKALGFQA